jgi:hypothetical protein
LIEGENTGFGGDFNGGKRHRVGGTRHKAGGTRQEAKGTRHEGESQVESIKLGVKSESTLYQRKK